MANMYPDVLPSSVTSDMSRRAEVMVYRALRDSLPDECDVYYSVAWQDPRFSKTMDGEVDFVIVDRRRGFMAIEVKGGRKIGQKSGSKKWFTQTLAGVVHEIKDPVEQAKNNKYALREQIDRVVGDAAKNLRGVHAVVLPDSRYVDEVMGAGAPEKIFVFSSHMGSIADRIESIWDYYSTSFELGPIATEVAEKIRKLFAPSFTLSSDWSGAIADIDRKIDRLTESQFSVLDGLQRVPRAEISGGAGTGKTLLALEKSRRLADQGLKVLLTCYNRPLADRLSSLSSDLKNLDVLTFHQLCIQAADKASIERPDENDFDIYPQILEQSLAVTGPLYEAIIVDEGQDFGLGTSQSDWWTALELSLHDQGILYLFLDRNQSVYGDLGDLPNNLVPFDLTENLRNTSQIHGYARKLYSGSEFSAAGPRGPSVEFFQQDKDNATGTAEAVTVQLKRLRKTLEPEDVKVLVSDRKMLNELMTTSVSSLIYDLRNPEFVSEKSGADTIRRFKGLDSRAVILVTNGELSEEPELAYVGSTRARSVLSVIGTKADIGIVKKGLS